MSDKHVTRFEDSAQPLSQSEKKYAYSQSAQIEGQSGLIGYLRADMGSDGKSFFSTWNDSRGSLKTDEFKAEFDELINELRSNGSILSSRSDLSKYCGTHPETSFNSRFRNEYGIRIDTDKHSYLLRLCPDRGEYNLYCYCYVKEWLDDHIRKAERGIRFITPSYRELFRIPDGDMIRITDRDGETSDRTVRYVDDYHIELSGTHGTNLYHICEFSELMEASGKTVIPLRSSLPEVCFSTMPSTGELILIKKGESGCYHSDMTTSDPETNRTVANEENEKLGVTKAQEAAMLTGSMFGWAVPGADPKCYDENGMLIKSHRDRDDAR